MQSKKTIIGSAQAAEKTPRRAAQPRHEHEGRFSHGDSMREGPVSERPTTVPAGTVSSKYVLAGGRREGEREKEERKLEVGADR